MPSSSAVHEQLTDILVRVVGCPADAVTPDATLKDLGTDSLTVVEVGEELGRRFDLYLSDDTIDSMVTIQDAIDAVVRHDGSQPPSGAPSVPKLAPAPPAPTTEVRDVAPDEAPERRGNTAWFATRFALAGLVVGAVLGLGGAALVSASGIGSVDLPPIAAPTTPEPTATSTPTPDPTPTTETGEPPPTIDASSTSVSPGERFILSGAFPTSDEGEKLQIEVRDVGEGQEWDDFPIETTTRDGGTFKTELYTSRTGEREFRIKNTATGKTTPSVKVAIG